MFWLVGALGLFCLYKNGYWKKQRWAPQTAVWTASPGSLEEGKTQGSWQRLGSMFQVRDFFLFLAFWRWCTCLFNLNVLRCSLFNSVLYLFTLKTGVGGVGVVQLVGGFGGGVATDAPDEDSGNAAVTGRLYVWSAGIWPWTGKCF